jgi:C1A family cysteine protease
MAVALGCILSGIDIRDYIFKFIAGDDIPDSYSVPYKSKVLSQGKYGTCSACALSTSLCLANKMKNKTAKTYSYSFIFANRRAKDYQGEGLVYRQALHNLNHDGDCLLSNFFYIGTYQKLKEKITDKHRKLAKNNTIKAYYKLNSEKAIKYCLMKYGAVVAALNVYKDLSTWNNAPTEKSELWGAHGMSLVGWDEFGWIFQNSHGTKFGDKGLCHIAYDYPILEWWGFEINF